MEHACQQLEAETQYMETEVEEVLRHMKETVGALSDLRYGKFAKAPGVQVGSLEGEVVRALKGLEDACDHV
jgi:centromere-localized protein 2